MKPEKERLKGNISLSIKGRPLEIELDLPPGEVTVRRMLPVFQNITDSFVEFGVETAEAEGRKISCAAGCGACCRQPVPISESEAHDIADYVNRLEEPAQTQIKQRFNEALEKLSENGLLEKIHEADSKADRRAAALEYFGRGVPCPFLVDESCSVHKRRPLSCREYLVTSPAKHCSNPDPKHVETVEMPAAPSRVFRSVEKPEEKSGFLLLVSALEHAKTGKRSKRLQSGEKWIGEFFRNLADKGNKPAPDQNRRKSRDSM